MADDKKNCLRLFSYPSSHQTRSTGSKFMDNTYTNGNTYPFLCVLLLLVLWRWMIWDMSALLFVGIDELLHSEAAAYCHLSVSTVDYSKHFSFDNKTNNIEENVI